MEERRFREGRVSKKEGWGRRREERRKGKRMEEGNGRERDERREKGEGGREKGREKLHSAPINSDSSKEYVRIFYESCLCVANS